MNRPNGQQCLAKATIFHTSLWWLILQAKYVQPAKYVHNCLWGVGQDDRQTEWQTISNSSSGMVHSTSARQSVSLSLSLQVFYRKTKTLRSNMIMGKCWNFRKHGPRHSMNLHDIQTAINHIMLCNHFIFITFWMAGFRASYTKTVYAKPVHWHTSAFVTQYRSPSFGLGMNVCLFAENDTGTGY